MPFPKILLAQTIVQLCKLKHIKHIIISPGSRNAPLTMGFSYDNFFKCYSIVDERCAAFFALGIAQQLQEPTALVCTSGSAILNYYPAISEAFYSHIPLVILSADRPKHLVGIGDGQTINQEYVFKNHILYSANLKLDAHNKNIECDKEKHNLILQNDIQDYNEHEINTAINYAIVKNGPVHINIPFNEPLYETVDALSVLPKIIKDDFTHPSITESELNTFIQDWNAASKKMILVGVNYPNTIDENFLELLAQDASVVVFTETTSNLNHSNFFSSIDQIIAPLSTIEQQQLQPRLLLTFGGLIVSKKIKSFLRQYQPKQHWHIDSHSANNTFFCLSNHIKIDVNTFFKMFLDKVKPSTKNSYKSTLQAIRQRRLYKHEIYLKQIPFSDFIVFNTILKHIPKHYILQVGNSSAIRYTQLFQIDKTIKVFCNRGTSGIDGSTSTAIGCAVANTKPTVFITGDLSFLYDSNALWNSYIPKNFRIIVVNNQGGGIFRILPGHKNTSNFDRYFETTHFHTAEHLCKMFGFNYTAISNAATLNSALKSFYTTSDTPKLLEIFTPRTINDDILLNYFKFIK